MKNNGKLLGQDWELVQEFQKLMMFFRLFFKLEAERERERDSCIFGYEYCGLEEDSWECAKSS